MSLEKPALDGVHVVDFSHILAGPYCTQLLADAGARIIKIEPPGGEYSRTRGAMRAGADGATLSAYSAGINRGKLSIELDLKSNAGRSVAKDLIARADVVVENFAPGTLGRLGLALSDLRAADPRLITASISLWGVPDGHKLSARGGLAIIAEAESGFMAGIGTEAPFPFRIPIGDMASGLAAYAGIVTALVKRHATGRGDHVSISMIRTLLSLNAIALTGLQMDDTTPPTTPAGMGVFPTLDGYVVLGVNSDRLWVRLVELMGRPDLATDPKFARYPERDANVAEANAHVIAWTSRFTSRELIDLIGPSGLPCGRISTAEDILQNQELSELGYLVNLADGLGGTVRAPADPLGQEHGERRIPRPGEDTETILATELGLTDEVIARLRGAGAFGAATPALG
jgi:crotonobetainyl-CoA:carnitine CoA-transferase CaiB-like acyl-CoA transferase